MALKNSTVYRCLDKKALVFGFEIVDLLAIFLFLAALNFMFRALPYKFFITWVPALGLALFLRLGKAGKPENYLLHRVRFYFIPLVFSSFPLALRRVRFTNQSSKGKKWVYPDLPTKFRHF
jgi:hypothetical protein